MKTYYSTDGENYSHETVGDALDALDSDGRLAAGTSYWEADFLPMGATTSPRRCAGIGTCRRARVRHELDEGAVFPPELCNAPKPPTPSKTLIKAAIERGEPIAGARIVRKDRLTVK